MVRGQQVGGQVGARIDRQRLAPKPGQVGEDAAVAHLEIGGAVDIGLDPAVHQLDDVIDIGRDHIGIGSARHGGDPPQKRGPVAVGEIERHEARHVTSLVAPRSTSGYDTP